MYETFFGLSDLPFRLTPDPRYLFMSAKHREAFAHLVYGISEGSGFVAITGEVGAGKTTLIRTLLAQHAQDVTVASIVNPVLTSTELLQTINAELELPSRSTSRKELTEDLAAFLKSNRAAGRRTVIIVDEAQNLDPVVLEQLRLLTNLETATEKLLQVVLVGQPELHGILSRHDLRQLNQRVTERWHLDKLDHDEAVEYVRHRLRIAGAQTDLVEPKALDLVYRFTDGVPRLINILCHRAMLVAYTRSRGRVGTDEVAAAARELGYTPQVVASGGGLGQRLLLGTLATAAVSGVAYLLFSSMGDDGGRRPFAAATPATTAPATATLATATPSPATPATAPAPTPAPPQPAPVAPEAAPSSAVQPAPVAAPGPQTDTSTLSTLAARDVYEGAVADYSSLLSLWGAPVVGEADLAAGSLNLQDIAGSRGLRYFAVEVNDALLSVLDLPAIVEMTPEPDGDVRYVLLRTMDRTANTAELTDGLSISLGGFNAAWNGRVHLVFRDPEGLRYDLAPGSGGPAVSKLQAMLATVGVFDAPPNGQYDALTENAVRQFQEAHHVTIDGVTGPITQILLYNSLGSVARPTLAPEPGLAAAHARESREQHSRRRDQGRFALRDHSGAGGQFLPRGRASVRGRLRSLPHRGAGGGAWRGGRRLGLPPAWIGGPRRGRHALGQCGGAGRVQSPGRTECSDSEWPSGPSAPGRRQAGSEGQGERGRGNGQARTRGACSVGDPCPNKVCGGGQAGRARCPRCGAGGRRCRARRRAGRRDRSPCSCRAANRCERAAGSRCTDAAPRGDQAAADARAIGQVLRGLEEE